MPITSAYSRLYVAVSRSFACLFISSKNAISLLIPNPGHLILLLSQFIHTKKGTYISVSVFSLSAASYQLRRCSLYFVRRFSPSKYVRNSALHATHSLCASLSLLQIGSPAIPVPGELGPFTIDIKKDTPLSVLFHIYQQLPILPGRFQPSTFGVCELNFRVRHGYGWILTAIATESLRVCSLKTI